MSSTPVAHVIYAGQLVSRGYGQPLWHPEPTSLGEPLIGDVGFVQEGCFYRLFNSMKTADDPVNTRGVPDGFVPLVIDASFLVHTTEDLLPPGPIYNARAVGCRIEAAISWTPAVPGAPEVQAAYTFHCDRDQAAVLMLGTSGRESKVLSNTVFASYMRRHHTSWHAFARQKGIAVRDSDIILVSGWVKTSDWALAAVISYGRLHDISFSAGVSGFASATFRVVSQLNAQASIEQRRGPSRTQHVEPEGADAKDQCVFLRYYKQKTRLLGSSKIVSLPLDLSGSDDGTEDGRKSDIRDNRMFGRSSVLSVQRFLGGGQSLDRSSGEVKEKDEEANMPASLSVEEVPIQTAVYDPLDDLLDHILERSPGVATAIASHDDLYAICPVDDWGESALESIMREMPDVEVIGEPGKIFASISSLSAPGSLSGPAREKQDAVSRTSLDQDGVSRLHEHLQSRGKISSLSWEDVKTGPGHSPMWSSTCKIDNKPIAIGNGLLKFIARDAAAKKALEVIQREERTVTR